MPGQVSFVLFLLHQGHSVLENTLLIHDMKHKQVTGKLWRPILPWTDRDSEDLHNTRWKEWNLNVLLWKTH